MSADTQHPQRLLLAASIVAALLGAIVPLPAWLAPSRPVPTRKLLSSPWTSRRHHWGPTLLVASFP